MYTILVRSRIRAIFHPNPVMRRLWRIVFAYIRVKFYVVLIADYQMVLILVVGVMILNVIYRIRMCHILGRQNKLASAFFLTICLYPFLA